MVAEAVRPCEQLPRRSMISSKHWWAWQGGCMTSSIRGPGWFWRKSTRRSMGRWSTCAKNQANSKCQLDSTTAWGEFESIQNLSPVRATKTCSPSASTRRRTTATLQRRSTRSSKQSMNKVLNISTLQDSQMKLWTIWCPRGSISRRAEFIRPCPEVKWLLC